MWQVHLHPTLKAPEASKPMYYYGNVHTPWSTERALGQWNASVKSFWTTDHTWPQLRFNQRARLELFFLRAANLQLETLPLAQGHCLRKLLEAEHLILYRWLIVHFHHSKVLGIPWVWVSCVIIGFPLVSQTFGLLNVCHSIKGTFYSCLSLVKQLCLEEEK